ncbi:CfaE/CblD family pilus tip adhesin [Burkholderia territorii]|uniref:CfaE/CblD family pilus tip adhesin n=1 Tax=Burkholderia territorii TaxID=1503055 RepID=UPI00075F322A|nr:CfaE/CblD family pilus tip adhesin [Burkholderia territorii]KWA12771.1 pilin protein [Burkholderia territorii]
MTRANKSHWRAIVLAAALGVVALDARADMEAPASRNDTVQATYDRGTQPGDVVIFDDVSGGYDTSDPRKWSTNAWKCKSTTDTSTGACATQLLWQGWASSTVIKLLFKEAKTGATAVLNLQGSRRVVYHLDCNNNVQTPVKAELRQAIQVATDFYRPACPKITSTGAVLNVEIPAAELKKLPSGGEWNANLVLDMRSWAHEQTISVFKAAITLNVTDKNNIQVYLPEFTNATPVVDLKLRTLPNGSRLSGTSNVDMCLYDGYNSQSTWFDVTASDGLTIDRRDQGSYSVLLESDKSGAYASRVDYNVSLTYAGKKIALPNNETVRLQSVNNSAGRTVSLAGISVPVVCTPTPLTLETPEFQSVWKRPGKYSNKLTITFTPSSESL